MNAHRPNKKTNSELNCYLCLLLTPLFAPKTVASLGGNIQALGNVTVTASGFTDADTVADSASGGLVTIQNSNADAFYAPIVTADIANDAVVRAAGNVAVNAVHGRAPTQLSDGSFDAQFGVSPTADSITFQQPHGLRSGDSVTYQRGTSQAAIPGLTDGRTYNAIMVDGNKTQLGATAFWDGAVRAVDLSKDTIIVAAPHNLITGDAATYKAGASLGC